jgi:signal transduction histidine kinase
MPDVPALTTPDAQQTIPPFFPRSIRGKLIMSLLAVFLLGTFATAAVIYAMWRMEDRIQIIESFYELNQKVLETRRYEKNYLLFGNEQDLMLTFDYLDEVRSALVGVRALIPRSMRGVEPPYDQKLAEYADILRNLRNQKLPAKRTAALREELRERGHALTKLLLALDARARQAVEREVWGYQKMAVYILGLAAMAGSALIFFLVPWIIGPLQSIRQAAARIMRGETSSIPLDAAIRDSVEGVELANSLNRMLAALDTKQMQLIQSAKLAALGRLTAGIAHEINNPLNNIYLTTEVLLEDLPNLDCSERLEMVHDILVQADRAREVVGNLLEFSRARKPAAMQKINLGKLVEDSLTLVKNQLRLGAITSRFHPAPAPVWIIADPHQLQQVFVNLILNGIQAMQPGGVLTTAIRIDQEKHMAVAEVRDTGQGIPAEVQRQIFDPFFTTKNEGTGLGLAVSYAIVNDHHGAIQVKSKPGQGTAFSILLPLAPKE